MTHMIVSREEWLVARKSFREKEDEQVRMRDELNAERLKMPWVRIEKDYRFEGLDGEVLLADLFQGRTQLIIYHFMFGPDWESACLRCSFLSDHINGGIVHLNNHDVSWVAVSRAPIDRIQQYKNRMGWSFPWVSSYRSDFNYDFGVSFTQEELDSGYVNYNYRKVPSNRVADEMSGLSAFKKDASGEIFHTCSAYARSLESLGSTLMALDLAPLGRNETSSLSFVRRRDEYGVAAL
jgi:predicted dithiol-disulfide oxidoreductase (DUF899 family)